MPQWLGVPELIIILIILLVIFGPKRLPEIGRSVGKGIKEFKKSTSELQEQVTAEEPKASTGEKAEAEKVEKAGAAEASGSKSSETKTS